MPRKPRFNIIGIPQHIIQRGNNREPCFFTDRDYQQYRSDLKQSAKKYHCRIHAYVLMANHVHILATPMVEHGVSDMMQALGRRYVCYINKTYQRTGTLWEGRFKSSLIDSDEYLFRCMHYIEQNPVRAKMVNHPGEYSWSSYQANAHLKSDHLTESHPLYKHLGRTPQESAHAYRMFFEDELNSTQLEEIRVALNHELVYGRTYFKEKIEQITHRQVSLRKPGRPKVEESQAIYLVGF